MSERLRVAFVGQQEYFSFTALRSPADGVEPRFFHMHHGGDIGTVLPALRAFAPDAVVAFRPELFARGAFDEIDAVVIGFLSEPIPRPGRGSHWDLDYRMNELRGADAGNFDRIVIYDPYIEQAASEVFDVWRSLPLPISDEEFTPQPLLRRARTGPPVFLFTGKATDHRNAYLDPIKKDFDVIHLAHGVTDERLAPFLARADVGINLHNEDYVNYENRVSQFAAAGLAIISEPLSPRWGLEPGVDYLEVSDRWDLYQATLAVTRTPGMLRAMRLSARAKAERFRASTVWPRLVRDALADVALFGTGRRTAAAAAGRTSP